MLSIRIRLALWYAVALFSGLGVSALGASFALHRLLIADVDASLAEWAGNEANIFADEMASSGIEHARDEVEEHAATLPKSMAMRIETPQGGILDSVGGAESLWPSVPAGPVLRADGYSTVQNGDAEMRVLARHVVADGTAYRLQIAASLAAVNALRRRFHVILLWTLPLALAIASLGGYWISARALAPVDALTTAARAIGIGNLSQRLEIPRARDELQRLSKTWNEMLERLEGAVARLSQFTADASHELRSPMALIRATAEIALSEIRTPEQYRAALEQILSSTLRITGLMEELLEVARSEAGSQSLPFSEIDLRDVVKDARERMLVVAAARQQTLTARLPEAPATVTGNDTALRRLLVILIDNAIKFTPPGGRVEVTVENGGPRLAVRVRDNGIGISAEALPHIFDRFFRADPSRSLEDGAGLGLSIAQAITRAHAAAINVKSAPGTGSVFSVEFPDVHAN